MPFRSVDDCDYDELKYSLPKNLNLDCVYLNHYLFPGLGNGFTSSRCSKVWSPTC